MNAPAPWSAVAERSGDTAFDLSIGAAWLESIPHCI